jgi:hypothetical protein
LPCFLGEAFFGPALVTLSFGGEAVWRTLLFCIAASTSTAGRNYEDDPLLEPSGQFSSDPYSLSPGSFRRQARDSYSANANDAGCQEHCPGIPRWFRLNMTRPCFFGVAILRPSALACDDSCTSRSSFGNGEHVFREQNLQDLNLPLSQDLTLKRVYLRTSL